MFIRDSRRSYRTYSYAELILITDLCAFRTPVEVTELMLMLLSLTYSEVPVGTTEITERILVFRSTYLSYRTYYCISDTEVPVGTTEHFTGTKVPVGATEQIPYKEVLVGTTGLILILRIREYS